MENNDLNFKAIRGKTTFQELIRFIIKNKLSLSQAIIIASQRNMVTVDNEKVESIIKAYGDSLISQISKGDRYREFSPGEIIYVRD